MSFRTMDPVVADTQAPTGSISINDGSQYTRSRYIYLNLYATDNRSQQGEIQFRAGEGISTFNINWGSWQQFNSKVVYTLAAGDGQRNIWITYRDAAAMCRSLTGVGVVLDTRAPGITGLQAYNITTTSPQSSASIRTSRHSAASNTARPPSPSAWYRARAM